MGKKIVLRENRIPTYVVMNKYNNSVIGVYATQNQVYSSIRNERNLDNLVVADITYSNKVDIIDFLIKYEKYIVDSIIKEIELHKSNISRLERAKSNYVAKLRELNEKKYHVLEAIDSTIKSIEDISLKKYNHIISLDKENRKLEMFNNLMEQKIVFLRGWIYV